MHTSPTTRTTARLIAAAALLGSALALTACSTTEKDDAAADSAAPVTVTDAWVKAADEGMTAAFGLVENTSDDAVTIVGASTEVSPMVELHETVADADGNTAMQEVEGGFTIEPGETLTLEPGGNHIMMMNIAEALEPGAEVTVTLEFEDGTTLPVTAVVKEFSGAQEEYTADMDDMDMDSDSEDMEMSPSSSADGE